MLPEVKSEEDLLPPGAPPGSVPTDLEQATGLERLEILGKMQGVDIFDMRPLDASRKGMRSAPDAHYEQFWSWENSMCYTTLGNSFTCRNTKAPLLIGTLDNPIMVRSFGDEQYAGCTGYPADSHWTIWLTVSPCEFRESFVVISLDWAFGPPPAPLSRYHIEY